MAKETRLVRRGGRWYFRCGVPKDIRSQIGKREIKRSLGTSDYPEAVKMARLVSVEVDAEFARARFVSRPEPATQPTETELRQLALAWFHDREREAADRHLMGQDGLGADQREALSALDQDEGRLERPDELPPFRPPQSSSSETVTSPWTYPAGTILLSAT